MGLTDLDEAIWKQYEKLTHYCNKTFGWDKFDLAKKANGAYLVSGVGYGFYEGLEGALGSSSENYVTAGIFAASAGMLYAINRMALTFREQRERSYFERSGVAEAPQAKAWRPLFGALLPFGIAIGLASYLGDDKVPENLALSLESYNRLDGLQSICNNLQTFFFISYFYLADQI